MSILNLIGDVCYTLFFILLLIMAAVVFYDYLNERSRIKEEVPEADSYSDEDQNSINSAYSMIISDLSKEVCVLNEISENISVMKNPNLKFVLEELNAASERILRGVQAVVDLNCPIDELENENETCES